MTLERYGVEHFRELGRKGGQTTLARHGTAHLSKAGRLGYEAMVKKYFNGDYAAANAWLSSYGLYMTDPIPGNGAFTYPGDFPSGEVVLVRSDDTTMHGSDQGRTYVKGTRMSTRTVTPYVADDLLEALGVVVQPRPGNDGQVLFLLPNGWGLSALTKMSGSVKAIEWQPADGGFTFEVVGLAPGQMESFDSLDEIPALLEALAPL